MENTIIYTLIIYFGFKLYYQLFAFFSQIQNIKSSQEEILNFTATMMLVFIYIFIKKPSITFNKSSIIPIFTAVIFSLLYCYTYTIISNQTIQERENNMNASKQTMLYFVISFFSIIAIITFVMGVKNGTSKHKMNILLSTFIIATIYIGIVLLRNRDEQFINFPTALFLYPLLFALPQNQNSITLWLQHFIFVSVIAILSYIGIQYFIGNKVSQFSNISINNCKNLLNIQNNQQQSTQQSAQQTAQQSAQQTRQTNIVRNLYIAFVAMICMLIVGLVVAFIRIENKNKN